MKTIQKSKQAHKEALANISQEDLKRIVSKIDRIDGENLSYLKYIKIINKEKS